MVLIVALYVPWCRHLEVTPDVKPQLYADNLKCSAERLGALFDAARFTARYVRAVGQDVSPGACLMGLLVLILHFILFGPVSHGA